MWRVLRARQGFGTTNERATYDVLHLANQAAPLFRRGLNPQAAERAARPLRRLLGSTALSISDGERLLAWEGEGAHHGPETLDLARPVVSTGRVAIIGPPDLRCDDPDCAVRAGVIVPIVIGDDVVGTLGAFGSSMGAGTIRAATELAQLGCGPARAGRARPIAGPGGRGRGAGAAGTDLAPLHLQRADRDRRPRPVRSRPRPRAASPSSPISPLQLPQPGAVHDAGRRAPFDRRLPHAGAGPFRCPAVR